MSRLSSFFGPVGLLTIVVILGGCADGAPWSAFGEDEVVIEGAFPDVDERGTQLEDGWLAGDLGDVTEFSGTADPDGSYLWTFGDRTEIILQTGGRGWAAMALLFVEGDLSDPRSVDAIGCSGPDVGGWEYDAPAENVSITPEIGENGEVEDVAFEMTFHDGSHVEGSVQTTAGF